MSGAHCDRCGGERWVGSATTGIRPCPACNAATAERESERAAADRELAYYSLPPTADESEPPSLWNRSRR